MPTRGRVHTESLEDLEFNVALQPKQFKLLEAVRSGVRYPFYGGARGGGKSYASRIIMLIMLMENPGSTGLLIRRTFKQLDGNHIRPLFRQFPKIRSWYNKSEGVMYLPNGSELMFGHAEHEDDVFNYQGQEFDFVAVEEVTQFTEFQWQYICSSCRTANKAIKPVMWATGNPGGVGHAWAKRLWVDRRFEGAEEADDYSFISAKVFDNPALMEADPRYVMSLKNIKDESLRKAYLNGDWDIYQGQFFTQWNRAKIETKSFEIPASWPLYGALDYGEMAPTSFGLYTVDFDGNVYRLMEYYQGDRSASQHAEEIVNRIKGFPYTAGRMPIMIYADPSMWVKRRLTEQMTKSAADVFTDYELPITRANNDRINGWRICRDSLLHEQFYTFEGWNDNFMRSVPALPRADKNPEDLDTHAEDHAADEWRYGMVHLYRHAEHKDDPIVGSGQNILDALPGRPAHSGRYHVLN